MPQTETTSESDFSELLGPELSAALAKKGYKTLTPVQRAVLHPALAERDLRLSSQTGSGKTLAIGFVLRAALVGHQPKPAPGGHPRALVITPTRELAQQVHDELGWLYAPMKLRVAAVTGGAVYRDEHRALARGPAVVVGTPGRLLDHLERGSIDASEVAVVVLDEADRMLDLGFRDELEAILGKVPPGHRTHLVSATFSRDVAALADRVQENPLRIEGTPLGTANLDIEHLIYLVHPRERVNALINVLLHHPDEQTLVFARTRADVAEIARELSQAGFASGALSGEMDQTARNRALAAFKRGDIRALIATDVAARGIDVQDIARVVQLDPPSDPDTYTHRSGRTGRAGRKGTSALLVAPAALRRTTSLLQRVGVAYRVEPVPSAAAIRAAQDERWLAELTQDSEREVPARVQAQVARIVESGLAEKALAHLLLSLRRATGEPRDITPLSAEPERGRRTPERGGYARDNYARDGHARDRGPAPAQRGPARGAQQWVPFSVSWGEAHGADARRLVAMLCRRGNIRGSDIGAIRVGPRSSSVEVAANVAQAFAAATQEPDPRDPRVKVTPSNGSPHASPVRPPLPARRTQEGATKPASAAHAAPRKAPFKADREPVRKAPFKADREPVRKAPFKADREPVRKAPFKADREPVRRAPFKASATRETPRKSAPRAAAATARTAAPSGKPSRKQRKLHKQHTK